MITKQKRKNKSQNAITKINLSMKENNSENINSYYKRTRLLYTSFVIAYIFTIIAIAMHIIIKNTHTHKHIQIIQLEY